ncbi:MAG: energy-coupling factor transporter transmembrane protein EcfT [Actinobacteria bacterium]|nr:energy-coupling factor transporter transmembrane protein EcfT [Actinomycetota bacterium]MBU2688905.1 energy-coupling factor transporter transmembrane protein EcfT [Actinomycetota bacterium]
MMPAYRMKHGLLQESHPLTPLLLACSLLLLCLLSSNPLSQLSAIAASAILALSSGVLREWASWWKLCLVVFIMALVINPLVARAGATVIWQGPSLPVLGRLQVTAEAVAFGAVMGLRLAAVIWVFALVTVLVDPDSVLGLLKGHGSRSALASALSMRMVPTTFRDASDLLDAQRARGLVRDSGGRLTKLKSRLPLVRRMLATSLDRGIGMAEAMESRGYGSSRRTRYREYALRGRDVAGLSAAACIAVVVISGVASGALTVSFYPRLSMDHPAGAMIAAAVPVLAALALLGLSRLWKRSNWLKSRI